MPLVNATPKGRLDGSTVTQFTNTTNINATTYTYPTTQTNLIIENSGEHDIYLTVGSVTDQLIKVDTKYQYDGQFTQFAIRSDIDSQEFIATAIYQEYTDFNSLNDQLNNVTTQLAQMQSQNYIYVQSNTYANLCPKDSGGFVTDWLPAITQAITDGLSQKRPIMLPFGDVKISNSIYISSSVRLVGFGKQMTTIKPQGSFSAIIVGSSGANAYYWELVDIRIDGGNQATNGIQLINAHEGFIRNVYVINCQKGLATSTSWSNSVSFSEFNYNTVANAELGISSNDFAFIDVQFNGFQTGDTAYGVHILTGASPSETISFQSCIFQNHGYDGVYAEDGRGLSFDGCYFESNGSNPSAIGVSADIRHKNGFALSIAGGCTFWGTNNIPMISVDAVQGVSVMGNYFSGSNNSPYSIVTSVNTRNAVEAGNYLGKPVNDLGNVLVSLGSGVFPQNITINKAYPILNLQTNDNTKPPSINLATLATPGQISSLKTYAALTLGSSGDLYLQHLNTGTGLMESLFDVTYNNTLKWLKPVVWQNGLTASRPSSPVAGMQYYDTTLNKPIWYNGTNWTDATGATV